MEDVFHEAFLCLNQLRVGRREGLRRAAVATAPPPSAEELAAALDLAVQRLPPALSALYHLRKRGALLMKSWRWCSVSPWALSSRG